MKKRNRIWILAVCMGVIVSMTACSDEKEAPSAPETESAPTKPESQSETPEEEQPSAPETPDESEPDQDGQAAQNENDLGPGTISIYMQNADVSGFDKKEVSLESITPETVLKKLAENGVVPSDTSVLSFTKKEMDGEQVIDLDLSEKFGTYIKEMGSSAEYLVIGSICNTYLDTYHCAKIHITVAGGMLATGHAEYPGYMTRFS